MLSFPFITFKIVHVVDTDSVCVCCTAFPFQILRCGRVKNHPYTLIAFMTRRTRSNENETLIRAMFSCVTHTHSTMAMNCIYTIHSSHKHSTQQYRITSLAMRAGASIVKNWNTRTMAVAKLHFRRPAQNTLSFYTHC